MGTSSGAYELNHEYAGKTLKRTRTSIHMLLPR